MDGDDFMKILHHFLIGQRESFCIIRRKKRWLILRKMLWKKIKEHLLIPFQSLYVCSKWVLFWKGHDTHQIIGNTSKSLFNSRRWCWCLIGENSWGFHRVKVKCIFKNIRYFSQMANFPPKENWNSLVVFWGMFCAILSKIFLRFYFFC